MGWRDYATGAALLMIGVPIFGEGYTPDFYTWSGIHPLLWMAGWMLLAALIAPRENA